MKKFFLISIALIFSHALFAEDIVLGAANPKQKSQSYLTEPKTLARFHEAALLHAPNDPVIGNPNGNVTLVEFFDYQCIHCIAMTPVISDLTEKNPNLRVVLKIFSLGRQTSTHAALAALAAEKQGKFLDFHHALLTANKELTDDVILTIAQSSGLDVAQLQKDMDSSAMESKLKSNLKLGQSLKIIATPAFFVTSSKGINSENTSFFLGEVSNASLQSAIVRASK